MDKNRKSTLNVSYITKECEYPTARKPKYLKGYNIVWWENTVFLNTFAEQIPYKSHIFSEGKEQWLRS